MSFETRKKGVFSCSRFSMLFSFHHGWSSLIILFPFTFFNTLRSPHVVYECELNKSGKHKRCAHPHPNIDCLKRKCDNMWIDEQINENVIRRIFLKHFMQHIFVLCYLLRKRIKQKVIEIYLHNENNVNIEHFIPTITANKTYVTRTQIMSMV